MNEALLGRVKNSLNKQFYTMNDSWLSDCVEYYLSEHENPAQEEIIAFVMNQWILCDLREINNEKGCLPRELKTQKCTMLPGKYILQMDKMYDIATSKYKQLEKIRNVSSENIEATENENATQEDKYKTWEPKSKRMLQLFLTDGKQDVLAIEYKPIRFLQDSLYPGYKLMIKGPVTCRKGVILLEEINIVEIGGEVESLLIVNAVENVFARALNLEENPDPYNDNNKQNTQNNQNTKATVQVEDDFNIDSDALDQIDKQIQQNLCTTVKNNQNVQPQNISRPNNNVTSSAVRSQQSNFINASNNNKKNDTQKASFSNKNQSKIKGFEDDDDLFLEMVDEKTFNTATTIPKPVTSNVPSTSSRQAQSRLDEFPTDEEVYDLAAPEKQPTFSNLLYQNKTTTKTSSNSHIQSLSSNFSMTNKKTISDASNKNLPPSKPVAIKSEKNVSYQPPSTTSSRNVQNRLDEFPTDEEVHDLVTPEKKTPFANSSQQNKAISKTSNSHIQALSSKFSMTNKKIISDTFNKNIPQQFSSVQKSVTVVKPTTSCATDFPDDDFDFSDFDVKPNVFQESTNKSEKSSSQESSSESITSKLQTTSIKAENSPVRFTESKSSKHSSSETKFGDCNSLENFGNEFDADFDVEFEATVNDFKPSIKSEEKLISDKSKMTSTTTEIKKEKINNVETGVKRTANAMSPTVAAPQKVRCLQNSPKVNKTSNRKITDFLSKPSLINDDTPKIIELIQEVLQKPVTDKGIHTVIRGKVINVIKLNLLKGKNGSYFHLEGSVTDQTGSLDIVFSSEVLEKIIGYSPLEFSQKRKLSKTNATIKDQLVEDLKKAQQTLRVMDALMEIEIKKNEKALVLKTFKLSSEQKQSIDKRVRELKK